MALSKHIALSKHRDVTLQLSRLWSVSLSLKDDTVARLVKENRELKLKLFHLKHSPAALLTAMGYANRDHVGCDCFYCIDTRRNTLEDSEDDTNVFDCECQFSEWFQRCLKECNMTFSSPTDSEIESFHDDRRFKARLDSGAYILNCGSGDWSKITYGTPITNATSCKDKPIRRLRRLFRILKKWRKTTDEDEATSARVRRAEALNNL